MNKNSINFELKRKAFHLCALIFPIIYIFLQKKYMVAILAIITLITIYLDIYRHSNLKIKEVIQKFFGFLLRDKEQKTATDLNLDSLSGSSYMALGFFITALLFAKGLTIASWLILIICDSAAAIIGKQHGKTLDNGKSYEGSGVFFALSILIGMLSYFIIGYNTSFFVILLSSILTTCAEFYAKDLKLNDNLSIPCTYAFSTYLFSFVF